jgi:hypothetical protein
MVNGFVFNRGTFLLLACAFLAASGLAQTTSSSLRGTVTDPSGSAIPGATLTLSNTQTGLARSTKTAQDGVYQFLQVPPGMYTVAVTATGFKSATLNAVQLLVNTPSTADVVLQVGTQAEQITVTAEASTLNTEDATLGTAFEEQQVKELPIESRNVVDLLSLQAGVVYTGNRTDINVNNDTRSGSVNGARSDQTMVTMDGVDVTDQSRGLAFTSVLRTTPDSLQEFRVVTTNPVVSDGSSSGASVKLLTKSGTNAFHGSLYEFNRNTATSANDYFIKEAQLSSGDQNKAPQLIRNVYGVSLGGPIIKNRLFFFANFEGRRDAEALSQIVEVPTASLRAGELQYVNANGGVTTVTPQMLKAWDPQGIGANAVMLKYFQTFPLPNDSSIGDGLNFSGYRFAAPIHNRYDVFIGRMDYRIDSAGKNTVFWRGSVQNDYQNGVPFLPGGPPETATEDRSKGFTTGYTGILSANLVNEFRWGYTRASLGTLGDSGQQFLSFAGLPNGITRSSSQILPVHNFVDTMNWIKGKHTIQFGGDALLITEASNSLATSFSQGSLSAVWLNTAGIANTGSDFDPAVHGLTPVATSFQTSYDNPAVDLLGLVTNINAEYNYDKNGNVLAQGTPILRHYAIHDYDAYIQDSFRIKPNLTVIYGVRYQLESPPWETNGVQVAPNVNMTQWLTERGLNAYQGITGANAPTISYGLAGSANGKPGFYNYQKLNFAPRGSFAYTPRPTSNWLKRLFGEDQTSVRGGFSMAYDHFGMEVINTFNQYGSYGLSTSLGNPGNQPDFCAPRVTSLTAIPTVGCAPDGSAAVIFRPAPAGGFPQTPSGNPDTTGFTSGYTSDSGLKTPYVYMLNFSVARALPGNSTLEISYVGHLSHRLLSQVDFAQPTDFVDPKSGVDYYTAVNRLGALVDQGIPLSQITNAVVGPTAAYWNDLYAPLAANGVYNCKPGQCTPIQAAYDFESRWRHSEVFWWFFQDPPSANYFCAKGCSSAGPYVYTTPQFWSLNGWTSEGNASYHALQIAFRKRLSHGVQFDVNYVWSKSEDLTSDAARVGPGAGTSGIIVNSYSSLQMKGVSDFDMTQQLNANWVAELPFGRGRAIGADSSKWMDAIIGGWQLAGIYRITSGLPYSVSNGVPYWPTNGQTVGFATWNGTPIKTGTVKTGDGSVLMFQNPTAAFNSFDFTAAGQTGSRNVLRGDGFLGLDASLSKRWIMPYSEHHSLQFRWEVFNVGNFTRFDVQSNIPSLTAVTSFGKYTGLLTNPRVMQFGMRYEF